MIKPEDHVGLVYSIVFELLGDQAKVSDSDYVGVGLLAIVKASSKYSSKLGKPSTFLAFCIKNAITDYRRKENRYRSKVVDGVSTDSVGEVGVKSQQELEETKEVIEKEISRLPVKLQEALRLRIDGDPVKAISNKMGSSEGVARARISQARKVLKERLNEHGIYC